MNTYRTFEMCIRDRLKGETSYESVLGSTVTLPQFDAYIVEIQ